MITENLSTLKIHKLTQAQYDRELEAGNVDESALYMTPDEDDDGLVSDNSVDTKISSHNTSTSSHNDIRGLITTLTNRLNALADSDDTTLDQISEIVAYIKNNKTLIESVTTSKINTSDIVNNLTTSSTSKVLSASQGVAIKALIDTLQESVDGKTDSGHKHAASDITSGTFNTARLPTIPLNKGGTNATSAASARTNLSVYSKAEVDAAITAAIGDAIGGSY